MMLILETGGDNNNQLGRTLGEQVEITITS